MEHYSKQVGIHKERDKKYRGGVVCDELTEKLALISKKRVLISDAFSDVKNSEKLIAFSEKVKKTGGVGVVGLLPKIPDIIPELSPILGALQEMNDVTNLQFKVIEILASRLQDLEGRG